MGFSFQKNMSKGKVTATTKVKKVKKKPIKAGSTTREHGGFPTQAVIKLNAKIKNKKNG